MTILKKISTILTVAFTLFSASALADPANSVIGITGVFGPSFVNNNVGTQFLVGGELQIKLDPSYGVGFFGAYESLGSGSVLGVSLSNTLVTLQPEANYYFVGDLSGLFLGIRAGIGLESLSTSIGASSSSSSTTVFGAGPELGYDFMIVPGFSLGVETGLEFYSAPSNGNSLTVFNFLGRVGLHF